MKFNRRKFNRGKFNRTTVRKTTNEEILAGERERETERERERVFRNSEESVQFPNALIAPVISSETAVEVIFLGQKKLKGRSILKRLVNVMKRIMSYMNI